jgi:DNA-binding NarL/FixJ family response regulator
VIRVVGFTAALDDDEMLEAFRLGVGSIVLKEMPPTVLLQSIRAVHAGRRWLDPPFSRLAAERLLKREIAMRRMAGLLSPLEIANLPRGGQGRA